MSGQYCKPPKRNCGDVSGGACASDTRSAPLRADTLKTSEDSTSDALFAQELMASMQPTTS